MKWRKLLCFGMAVMLSCSCLSQMPIYAQEMMQEEDTLKENKETVEEALEKTVTGIDEKRESILGIPMPDGIPETQETEGQAQRDVPEITSEEDVTADYKTKGGYKYKELKDGTLEITEYTGSATELVVPAKINGKQVSKIGGRSDGEEYIGAFLGCSSLCRIELPEGITSIGSYAFYECNNLSSIELSEGVTNIGRYAFYECSSLGNINLPNGITSIGDWAFSGCSSLGSIKLPKGITNIESSTFSSCSSLGSIKLPEEVTAIGSYAFSGCSSLGSIKLPKSVTSIEGSAFYGCSNLAKIIVESGNTVYASQKGILYDKKIKTLICCPGGKTGDIKLPEGITSIGDSAFSGCSNLSNIKLPEGITNIGDSAFYGCRGLSNIKLPNGITSIGSDAFSSCSNLNSIKLPESVTEIRWDTFSRCNNLSSINLPESITSIRGNAFRCCRNLSSIKLPKNITSIEDSAFYGCSSLGSIELPEGVTSIGESAFYGCSSLGSIELSGGITSIGESAFYGCSSLGSIELPEGITSIGESAFYGCSSLGSIELPEGITSIGESAFYGCGSLGSIELPGGITSIEEYVFRGCSSLGSIELPEGITSIEWGAFLGCSSLGSIKLPKGITNIGRYAFRDCSSLGSIELPERITSISEDAFYGCSSLTEIIVEDGNTIYASLDGILYDKDKKTLIRCPDGKPGTIKVPEGVTQIGYYAFDRCSSLTEIIVESGNTIYASLDGILYDKDKKTLIRCPGGKTGTIKVPEGVSEIEAYAFQGCSSLGSIELPRGITSIREGTFYGCSNLRSIKLPESLVDIVDVDDAFSGCSSLTEFIVESGNTVYASLDGILYDKEKKTLIRCPEGKTGTINLPEGITSIGDSAFGGCSSLTDIIVENDNTVYASLDGILYDKDKKTLIRCPGGKQGDIKIPGGVTRVGGSAFQGCSNINSIELPEGITKIGVFAFYRCSNLSNINLPEGITVIGRNAFSGCSSLSSINLPEGITVIENNVFSGCTSLSSINLPKSVTSIEYKAFSGCSSLSSLNLPKSVTGIEEEAFSGCNNLTLYIFKGSNVESNVIEYVLNYKYIICDHDYQPQITTATTKTNGKRNIVCTNCGEVKSTETIYAVKTIKLSKTSYTYNGKTLKPSVTIKDSKGKALKNKTDYTLSYDKGRKNVGLYTVTIKFKGTYQGTVKKTFTIKPKSTNITKLTPKKKGLTLKWKKQTQQTTGYEIAYSTNSRFPDQNTTIVTVKKNKTVSKSISKLKAKKKYYVRIRTYKTVKVNKKSKKIYSAWSKVNAVVTKK